MINRSDKPDDLINSADEPDLLSAHALEGCRTTSKNVPIKHRGGEQDA